MDAYSKLVIFTGLVVIAAAFEGPAAFFVALRFHLCINLMRSLKSDDWSGLLSLVSRMAGNALYNTININ